MELWHKIAIGWILMNLSITCITYLGEDVLWSLLQPWPRIRSLRYWGPGSAKLYAENTTVEPFNVTVDLKLLQFLHEDLNRTIRIPKKLENTQPNEYGLNDVKLRKFIDYWRDEYLENWETREKRLMEYKNYRTEIQGLKIHFVHVKGVFDSRKKISKPLLLLHGWPGSVLEFYNIIPQLTHPNPHSRYVFDVVIPSLPGFGWSDAPAKPGLSPSKIPVIMQKLMLRLGYKQYFVHGTGWGSLIGSNMAAYFPHNVQGFHSNMCYSSRDINHVKRLKQAMVPYIFAEKDENQLVTPIPDIFSNLWREYADLHFHATKPDTLGAVLSNNPVGLAAYMLEKYVRWSDPDISTLEFYGVKDYYFINTVLDNVMFYYNSGSIMTSLRMAKEYYKDGRYDDFDVNVPTGCVRFKYELMHTPDWLIKHRFKNLVHSTYYDKGGHFPAVEATNILYKDLTLFVENVCRNEDGYESARQH